MAASGKKNMFNEATRVQMPAMVHLTRLGYTYFGKITEDMAGTVYDPDTNILINVFKEQFARLNPTHAGEAEQTLKTIRQELDNDDIGRSFYERLSSVSPVRLVDFENPKNNTYHFTAEFTCKRDQDEFRPDITLFVNGLPLVFVEVKKPNNHGGMVAESKRMNQKRFPNKKFRRFLNITQLMIFSNNMEYDTMGGIVPVQGAFYCTTAKQSAPFNCFREENPTNLDIAPYNADFPYKDIDPIVEKKILTDFNCQVIHTSPEYQTNLDTYTPTNRVLTSMCSPERLLFILKYGIAYVRFHKEINGKIEFIEQKHIMRYQQMFAALKQTWSVRTLQRNISSQYYYRMLKTQKKELVESEMKELTAPYQNDKLEFIKNPVVAEFLGFSQNTDFTESDLEKSILSNLQKFLMELGKGYAFVARQQHIHTEKQDYYIDLVFYNYILKCFVLIDLKTEKITHQDVGQMDMYIRMYDELKRSEGDNPTIGIVLCSDTDDDIARYSVMHGNEQLFASKYKLYLPTKEELKAEIETQKAMFYLQQQDNEDRNKNYTFNIE